MCFATSAVLSDACACLQMELVVAEEAPVGPVCPTVLAFGLAGFVFLASVKKSLHRPDDHCWHWLVEARCSC